MVTIALLNEDDFLVGISKLENPSEDDVIVNSAIDLPMDGTYKWDKESKSFIPLGHGFERPDVCPVPNALVLYRLSKQISGATHPNVALWQKWYKDNLLQQHTESIKVQ